MRCSIDFQRICSLNSDVDGGSDAAEGWCRIYRNQPIVTIDEYLHEQPYRHCPQIGFGVVAIFTIINKERKVEARRY